MEEGHSLTDQSSVSDCEAWNTGDAQKGLEDSKGAITSLGHLSTGSEARARVKLGSWRPGSVPC